MCKSKTGQRLRSIAMATFFSGFAILILAMIVALGVSLSHILPEILASPDPAGLFCAALFGGGLLGVVGMVIGIISELVE